MHYTRLFALAAVFAAGTAVPAFADWNRLGSVPVSGRETARVYGSFGGPVEKLQFSADRNVYCRSVRVNFANGRSRNVFSGYLSDERARVVDLPGSQRAVRRIDFRCRAMNRRSAQIYVAADIGSYRETWRRHPNFERVWSHLFNWDDNDGQRHSRNDRGYENRDNDRDNDSRNDRDDNRDDWVRLGSERFDGRETESTFAGFRGRGLTAIALQPVDDDARCSMVRVHFANGNSRDIRLGERLSEDRMYRVDLPGDERNVTRLELTCRPVGDNDVTVNIFGLT